MSIRRRLSFFVVICLLLSCTAPPLSAVDSTEERCFAEGEAIVLLSGERRALEMAETASVGTDKWFEIMEYWDFSASGQGVMALVSSEVLSTEALMDSLVQLDAVTSTEPNYELQAKAMEQDPYVSEQWWLGERGINAPVAWNNVDDENIPVVAVLDTGVDYTHPELARVMWSGDAHHGYDFINDDDDPMDDNGHGTRCAGIIAASVSDGAGMSGISDNVRIMALKVLDENGNMEYSAGVLSAYSYMINQKKLGVNIVAANNSWGGGENTIALSIAVSAAGEMGIISVFAAGNDGADNDTSETIVRESAVQYMLNVAASNEYDSLTSFSNYGAYSVQVAAPGEHILTTTAYTSYPLALIKNDMRFFDTLDEFSEARHVLSSVGAISYYSGYRPMDGHGALLWSVNENHSGMNAALAFELGDIGTQNACVGYYVASVGSDSEQELVRTTLADTSAKNYYTVSVDKVQNGFWTEVAFQTTVDIYGNAVNIDTENAVLIIEYLNSDGENSQAGCQLYIDALGVYDSEYGRYTYGSGTSMAAPMVSGAIASMVSYSGAKSLGWSSEEIRARIISGIKIGSTKEMSGKVAADGIFSVEAAMSESLRPVVTLITQYGSEMILEGYFFSEDMSVSINGVQAENVSVLSNNQAVFELEQDVQVGSCVLTVRNVFGALRTRADIQEFESIPSRFSDIIGHWAESYIKDIISRKIMNGVSVTAFAPDLKLTRAMFVTVLGRMDGANITEYISGFTDLDSSLWYYRYVMWAAENKIISGRSEQRFDPDGYITREEMAVIIARYMAYRGLIDGQESGLSSFEDAGSISEYAKNAVALMEKLSIITGYPDGRFLPHGNCTRAEAVTVIERLITEFAA